MRTLKLIFLMIGLVLVIGCSDRPIPKVIVSAEVGGENIQIPVVVANSLWLAKATYGGPVDSTNGLKATIVPPNSEISFEFEYPPDEESLHVTLREPDISKDDFKRLVLDSQKLKAPTEKGIYVYSISGEWSEGQAAYAFKIEVK